MKLINLLTNKEIKKGTNLVDIHGEPCKVISLSSPYTPANIGWRVMLRHGDFPPFPFDPSFINGKIVEGD